MDFSEFQNRMMNPIFAKYKKHERVEWGLLETHYIDKHVWKPSVHWTIANIFEKRLG